VLQGEWYIHELQSCPDARHPQLAAMAIMPFDAASRIPIFTAWLKHYNVVAPAARRQRPAVERSRRFGLSTAPLTQSAPPLVRRSGQLLCTICGESGEDVSVCAGCDQGMHVTPCGSNTQRNTRRTVNSQNYHNQLCVDIAQREAVRAAAQAAASAAAGPRGAAPSTEWKAKKGGSAPSKPSGTSPSTTKRLKANPGKDIPAHPPRLRGG
jgi:hypothetical protein